MDNGISWVLGTGILIVVVLIVVTVYFAMRDKEMKMSGRDALEGEIGVASTDIAPEGKVLVHGEWWNARSQENITKGTKVKVVKAEKMLIHVVPAPEE